MKTKNYTKEEKLKALAMVDSGQKIYEVAKKLGIKRHTLYAWTNNDARKALQAVRTAATVEPTNGHGYVAPVAATVDHTGDDRLRWLERENAALRELVRLYAPLGGRDRG